MKINYFGISLIAAAVLLAGLLTLPIRHAPGRLGPKGLTFAKMKRLEAHMLNFFSVNGRWPDSELWKEELAESLSRDAAFPADQILVDAWGTAIRYVESTRYVSTRRYLHSFGPNRLDDRHAGDDIVLVLGDPQSSTQ
jgi:hypothetical protein